MKTSTRVAALLGTAALTAGGATVALALPASADVERHGSCGGASYDFSVERDDDRRGVWEISADIDRASAPRYRVVMTHEGSVFHNRVMRPDYERDIEVDRNRRDTAGSDTFVLRYRNLATNKLCTSKITVR